jgi:N-acetylmuramoyl-L-alanine amidase
MVCLRLLHSMGTVEEWCGVPRNLYAGSGSGLHASHEAPPTGDNNRRRQFKATLIYEMRGMHRMHVLCRAVIVSVCLCLVAAATAAVLGCLPGAGAGAARWYGIGQAPVVEAFAGEPALPVQAGAGRTHAGRGDDLNLLARVISAEAQGEPISGQVAVAAVILNRVRHPSFPKTLSGVIFQPHAFESVSNGLIWRRSPDQTAVAAARQALNGWDPTYGCVFFWNPSKPVSRWIWSRQIVARIGSHVFAR